MARRVEFTVKGPPQTWERTGKSQHNTPEHQRAKRNIAKHAWVAMVRARLKPFTGPVKLTVLAVYPRPQRCPEWTTQEAWATGQRLYRPVDADADNIAKLCADAIQPAKAKKGRPRPAPVCLGDDNQVCDLRAIKGVGAVGEKPHTTIIVEELPAVWCSYEEADGSEPAASSQHRKEMNDADTRR